MANELRFLDGNLLFDGGNLAMSEDCCCADVPVSYCVACDEDLPDEASVTISGFVSTGGANVADCPCYNLGTVTVTRTSGCEWQYLVDSTCTGGTQIKVTMGITSLGGGAKKVQVRVEEVPSGSFSIWDYTIGSGVSCIGTFSLAHNAATNCSTGSVSVTI